MLWHLPLPDEDVLKPPIPSVPAAAPLQRHIRPDFSTAYRNLQFGWHAAKTLSANHTPFPGVVEGQDDPIFRAYLYNCSTRYYDQDIHDAVSLTRPENTDYRETIEALLCVGDMDIVKVAEAVNFRPAIVLYYEKLFFNIIDRRHDAMFIAQKIYPNTRMPELMDEYINNESLGMMLRRSGYNNGAADVLYMAGFSTNLLADLSKVSNTAALEALIMTNGYILARNGWLNQQANSAGMFNARTLIAAAKQGGGEEVQQSPFATMGTTLVGEVKRIMGAKADEQIARRQQMQVTKNPTKKEI